MAAVLSWGSSEVGALGQGERVGESLLPSQVLVAGSELEGREIVGVAAGDAHSIATDSQGNAYAWGRIKEGQLGLGMRCSTPVCKPTRVEALRAHRIVKACGGSGHSLFLTKAGAVFASGEHHERDCGSDAVFFGAGGRQLSEQKRRMIEKSVLHYFSNGAAGTEYLIASPSESESSSGDDSAVLEEGRSESLQVNAFKRVIRATPWEVKLQSEIGSRLRVKDISAGHCFSAAVTECGGLFTWGYNDKGQLGLGDRIAREAPTRVSRAGNDRDPDGSPSPLFRTVSCGEQHTACLDVSGQAWAFGLGIFGQLGLGDGKDRFTPFKVEALEAVSPITQVACGTYHTVFLNSAGQVYICGHKEYGQQGEASNFAESASGRSQSVMLPQLLQSRDVMAGVNLQPEPAGPAPPGVDQEQSGAAGEGSPEVSLIACGSLHSVAITKEGQVLSWGWGGTGALGHGWGEGLGRRFAAAPVRAVEALARSKVVAIGAGRRHTVALVAHSQARHSLPGGGMRSLLLDQGAFGDVCFRARCGGTVVASRCLVSARCAKLAAIIALSTERFNGPSSADAATRTPGGYHRHAGEGRRCDPSSRPGPPGRGMLHVPMPRVSLAALRLLVAFLHVDDCHVAAPLADEVSSLARSMRLPRLLSLAAAAAASQGMSSACDAALHAPQAPPRDCSSFADDMLALLDTGLWSDVVLQPSARAPPSSRLLDLDFPPLLAHKAILSSRCEYFRVVLGSDFFVEGRQGLFSIDIGGFEEDEEEEGVLSCDVTAATEAPKARWRAFRLAIEWVYSRTLRLCREDGLLVIGSCLGEADRLMLPDLTEAVEDVIEEWYPDGGAFADKRQLGILSEVAARHGACRAVEHLRGISSALDRLID